MLVQNIKRGLRHIKNHKPCQDYVLTEERENITVMTVADGHGGEPYVRSGLGARMACWVARNVMLDDRLSQNQYCAEIKRRFDALVDKHLALRPLEPWELEKMKGQPHLRYAYGTTLLAMRITSSDIWCMQLGDGAIHILDEHGRFLPSPKTEQQIMGETASLVMQEAIGYMHTARHKKQVGVTLMHTDGYFCGDSRPWPIVDAVCEVEQKQPLDQVLCDGDVGDDQSIVIYFDEVIVAQSAFLCGIMEEKTYSKLQMQLATLEKRKKELSGYLQMALQKLKRSSPADKEQLIAQTEKRYMEYMEVIRQMTTVETSIQRTNSEANEDESDIH